MTLLRWGRNDAVRACVGNSDGGAHRAATADALLREGKEEAGKWKCERRGVTGGRWGVKCQAEARRGLVCQANGNARPSTLWPKSKTGRHCSCPIQFGHQSYARA